MKIGIFADLRFTALNTPTGVTKHIIQMALGLYNEPGIEVIVLGAKDQLDANGNIPEGNALAYLKARTLPHTWHQIYWRGLLFNLPKYDKYTNDLDWVYCPKNDFIPLQKTKYAVTFHGAHELDPDYPNPSGIKAYLNKLRSKLVYHRMVKQAHLILTVSEFLKQKTIDWFQASPSKIAVVGNGVEDLFYTYRQMEQYNPNSYYLSVGGLNFLDGGDRIIEIATALQLENNSREIWIAGNQHEPHLLAKCGNLRNIKLLGYLKKEALAEVMSNASALLFLTRYETFGIAAAEAMAIGLPVVTVNSTAVPEIVGDAGVYIDNFKLNEIDQRTNNHIFLEKISLGKKRAEVYHWHNCVNRLIKYLKQ